MIEISLLEQFDAFSRLGTLSKASEELHISQPALSRSMKRLEEELNMPLFVREGKRMRLNENGKLAAKYAARILDDEKEMILDLMEFDKKRTSITLGFCAPMPIIRLIPVLQMDYPGRSIITTLEAEDEKLLRDLKEDRIQLAIFHEKPSDPSIFCQRYLSEHLYLYVPKDHPLAGKSFVTLEEIAKYRIIVHRYTGFWLTICQQYIPESNLLIQESMDAIDVLAEASTLAMFNSDAMMQEGYDTTGRISIPISDPCMTTVYYAACRQDMREHYRTFFSAVRAEALHQGSHESN